eukprot:205646-Prorocentrum_lima.AAC.1
MGLSPEAQREFIDVWEMANKSLDVAFEQLEISHQKVFEDGCVRSTLTSVPSKQASVPGRRGQDCQSEVAHADRGRPLAQLGR